MAAQAFFADTAIGDGEQIYGPPPVQGEPSIQGNATGPQMPTGTVSAPGALIDSAIVPPDPPDKPLVDPERPKRDEVKTTPPKADEWLDFFSRIVLKVGMELYTDFAFRDIDENIISEADLRRIAVKKDERDTIAQPFAEFTSKTKFNTKSGRKVIALSSSAESLMTLGIWMRRVNRVAKKYKPQHAKAQRPQNLRIKETPNVSDGSNPGDGYIEGTTNGRIPGGFGVYNPGGG